MKVIWKGSIQLESGEEKITLKIPEGADEELYFLKKAVKAGEEIELRVISKELPVYQYENLLPIIRMIDEGQEKAFKEGYNKAKGEVEGLLSPEKEEEGALKEHVESIKK